MLTGEPLRPRGKRRRRRSPGLGRRPRRRWDSGGHPGPAGAGLRAPSCAVVGPGRRGADAWLGREPVANQTAPGRTGSWTWNVRVPVGAATGRWRRGGACGRTCEPLSDIVLSVQRAHISSVAFCSPRSVSPPLLWRPSEEKLLASSIVER